MGFQIGDQDVVGILAVLEERQLLGFHGVLRNGASYHDEATRVLPTQRLIAELSDLPSVSELVKAARPSPRFDGGVLLGHDGITAADRIQELDDPPAKTS